MFFSRVAVARGRCLFPVLQGLTDKRVIRLGGASFNQPVLKGVVGWVGRGLGAPGEGLYIVERKTRANEKDFAVVQAAQGFT